MRRTELNEELIKFQCRAEQHIDSSISVEFSYSANNPGKVMHDASKQSSMNNARAKGVDYFICLYPENGVFIIWDCHVHRKEHISTTVFRTGKTWNELLDTTHTRTYPFYRPLKGNKRDGPIEKVYVVSVQDYIDFFVHLKQYMAFNDYDETSETVCNYTDFKATIMDSSLSADERKIYSSKRKQRDARFRELVLASYGRKCAICRCPIESLLQAAHLKGHEVAISDLSEDRAENGICLCANHHLMYDNDLIEIDISHRTIQVLDNSVQHMAWYGEYVSKYKEKIEGQRSE